MVQYDAWLAGLPERTWLQLPALLNRRIRLIMIGPQARSISHFSAWHFVQPSAKRGERYSRSGADSQVHPELSGEISSPSESLSIEYRSGFAFTPPVSSDAPATRSAFLTVPRVGKDTCKRTSRLWVSNQTHSFASIRAWAMRGPMVTTSPHPIGFAIPSLRNLAGLHHSYPVAVVPHTVLRTTPHPEDLQTTTRLCMLDLWSRPRHLERGFRAYVADGSANYHDVVLPQPRPARLALLCCWHRDPSASQVLGK